MLRDKKASRYLQLDPPEYYSDRLMAATGGNLAVMAQFSAFDLFNDGTLGQSMLVQDFTASGPVNALLYIVPVKGQFPGIGPPVLALNPLQSQREGKISSGAVSALPAPAYSIPLGADGTCRWLHEWAVAEIPAGYSLRFVLSVLNTAF